MELRTEVRFCFDRLGLDPERLFFLDDRDWEKEASEGLEEVILVDHNVINTPEMKFLESKVRAKMLFKFIFTWRNIPRIPTRQNDLNKNVV